MTARMRRLLADYEQVKKDFAGHKNITVTPVGDDIPEQYLVTYFVNGIYLLPDGRVETLGRHEIEITLHAEYPRYKPLCKILTPIWHPNFRDGQICIGDIWGAGESLSDIIINIGDMIQYKSWNSFSPLSADAAQWAIENRHLFPVGNVDLYIADYASAKEVVEIDLFDDDDTTVDEATVATDAGEDSQSYSPIEEETASDDATPEDSVDENSVIDDASTKQEDAPAEQNECVEEENESENDFEITAEELSGIEFVPTAQRMQTISHGNVVKGKKLNFKTVFVKGLLWALIGAFVGFGISELTSDTLLGDVTAAHVSGHSELADYFEYETISNNHFENFNREFKNWCHENDVDPEDDDAYLEYFNSDGMTDKAQEEFDSYYEYYELSLEELYDVYVETYDEDDDEFEEALRTVSRTSTALWSAVIAMFIGLFLGIGEGVYYGSAGKAVKFGLIGAGVSLAIGYISGYIAQWMYSEMLSDDPEGIYAAFIRGIGWAIMGLGIGVSVGLIKPNLKRILYCTIGGGVGAFIGGFLFDYVFEVIPEDIVARGVAIVIMGILIGLGVGLLEQFAKSAWLKVIRGEFEGKEYLIFDGITSIGNNSKNTIVLFKDKLVGPHHCDINLQGGKYVLNDCGTPMGTIVNGRKISNHVLRQGDAIAIGNSVLIFNTK